jgi:hypothetical protein
MRMLDRIRPRTGRAMRAGDAPRSSRRPRRLRAEARPSVPRGQVPRRCGARMPEQSDNRTVVWTGLSGWQRRSCRLKPRRSNPRWCCSPPPQPRSQPQLQAQPAPRRSLLAMPAPRRPIAAIAMRGSVGGDGRTAAAAAQVACAQAARTKIRPWKRRRRATRRKRRSL